MPALPIAAALALVVAAAVGPLGAQSSGVYTADQASNGATIFAAKCALCHGNKLEGGVGPALAGQGFTSYWTGSTADDVYQLMSTQMPQNAPGSLKPDEYLAVLAYVLQQNHYPAGSTPLSAAALKSIKITTQSGS
jgi:mono/diheme cytochrome c family protein